jgi:DNA-binding transcriptional regulator YiaG
MRELDFINSQSPAPDAAITAYVDMYAGELSEQAIKALRAATRLSNKKLAKALAAIVQ